MCRQCVMVPFKALLSVLLVVTVAGRAIAGQDVAEHLETDGTPIIHRVVGYKPFADKVAQVEVIFARKPGVDPATAAARALHDVGATAVPSWSGFLLAGFAWAEFSDHSRRNNAISVTHNTASDPTGGHGLTAIENALETWNSVPGSMFRYAFGGQTARCPSLIDECTGGARFLGIPGVTYEDGHNDVAWVRIPLPPDFPGVIFGYFINTVDPFTGQTFEGDLVLNTEISPFVWRTDGVDGFPFVDVESVFLHELGHALGLAHAFNEDALMYFNYMASNERSRRPRSMAFSRCIRSIRPG